MQASQVDRLQIDAATRPSLPQPISAKGSCSTNRGRRRASNEIVLGKPRALHDLAGIARRRLPGQENNNDCPSRPGSDVRRVWHEGLEKAGFNACLPLSALSPVARRPAEMAGADIGKKSFAGGTEQRGEPRHRDGRFREDLASNHESEIANQLLEGQPLVRRPARSAVGVPPTRWARAPDEKSTGRTTKTPATSAGMASGWGQRGAFRPRGWTRADGRLI